MKIWFGCLAGLILGVIFVLAIQYTNFAPEKNAYEAEIDQAAKQVFNSGQNGKVVFIPKIGHRIVWPGQATPQTDPINARSAVTYGFSGGRLGDNLLSYLHARWIAYRDHIPFVFKSFSMADEFALALEPPPSGSITFREIPSMEIPFFPEPTDQSPNNPFLVDWDDPGFRNAIGKWLAPTKPHSLLALPSDRITVCVHVRRGGKVDPPSIYKSFPLKFPPDYYFIEQIRRISELFQGKPLYVFLMTDDLNPKAIAERYKKAVSLSNIEWDYRKTPPKNILDDFFSIPLFDCLIRGDSNFSVVASKLGEFAIEIAPTKAHCSKKNGKLHIDGIEIQFNAAKIAACKTGENHGKK